MNVRGTGTALLLALVAPASAAPPTFMDGYAAYEAGDAGRCADTLLAVEAAAAPVPIHGELLTVECLSTIGRYDEAFAYLRRQLPTGRIALDELSGKSRPGLDALRAQPGWADLRAEATALDVTRLANLDAALREELLSRAARDQTVRQAMIASGAHTVDQATWDRIAEVDRDNTAWLRQVLDARGWPDTTLVGHDGAKAAWLLVQHADHDPAFQRAALTRMQAAVESGRADRSDFALLTDRVLLAEGRPQRYGTQFQTGDDGIMRMQPVEDADALDGLRARVGLPAIAEYREMLRETYGQPVE